MNSTARSVARTAAPLALALSLFACAAGPPDSTLGSTTQAHAVGGSYDHAPAAGAGGLVHEHVLKDPATGQVSDSDEALHIQCPDGRQASPYPGDLGDFASWFPSGLWVHQAGDALLAGVGDPLSYVPAPFLSQLFPEPCASVFAGLADRLPETGFTAEKARGLFDCVKWQVFDPVVPVPLPPGTKLPAMAQADFENIRVATGLKEWYAQSQLLSVSDIHQLPRPAVYADECPPGAEPGSDECTEGEPDMAALEGRTLSVEVVVPASPIQEALKREVVRRLIDPVKAILKLQGYPDADAEYWATLSVLYAKPWDDPEAPQGLCAFRGFASFCSTGGPVEAKTYTLRGWFIRGDGVLTTRGRTHPLVIVRQGHSASQFYRNYPGVHCNGWDPADPNNPCQLATWRWPGFTRRFAADLVRFGYSVFLYDWEGSDVSEGWNVNHDYTPKGDVYQRPIYEEALLVRQPPLGLPDYPLVEQFGEIVREEANPVVEPFATGNSVNIFHIITQLAGGSVCVEDDCDGAGAVWHQARSWAGGSAPVQTGTALIGGDAPVFLYGQSHHGFIVLQATGFWGSDKDLFLNQSSLPYVRDKDGRPIHSIRSFNLKGVIAQGTSPTYKWWGIGDRSEFVTEVGTGHLLSELHVNRLFSDTFTSVVENAPAFMAIHGTYDDALDFEASVSTFNQVNAIKRLTSVQAPHGFALSEPYYPYTFLNVLGFLREALAGHSIKATDRQTTIAAAACQAPTTDIAAMIDNAAGPPVDVSPTDPKLKAAAWLFRLLKKRRH